MSTEAFKYYYYAADDTNCEGEEALYIENEMYGEFEGGLQTGGYRNFSDITQGGLQIGYTFIYDITSYELLCTDIDAPFSFAPPSPVNSTDNSTLYYATEKIYSEASNQCDGEIDVFTSYLQDRCFHYTLYTYDEEEKEWQPSDYSGKYVSDWSPSENIRFKKYVGSSCSDWNFDPVLENLKVINQCNDLREEVVNATDASPDVHVGAMIHTPLDSKVAHGFRKVKGLEIPAEKKAKIQEKKKQMKANSADKDVLEDFSSTFSYGEYAVYLDDTVVAQLDTRGYYSEWINTPDYPTPTAVPTVMPSHPTPRPTPAAGEPTAAPTHLEAYTFSAWMTLTNIDQDLWYEKESNTKSFVQAVAANMNSMDPEDITFGKVRNIHSTAVARKLRTLDEGSSSSENYVNDVQVDFQVTFILATVNFPNITEAYDALTGALYEGVIHTGLFDALLQGYSADNGGSLDNVKSVDVWFGQPESYDTTTEEHSKSTHSGLIVGTIIGLGVGLSCIGAMYYWVFYGSG